MTEELTGWETTRLSKHFILLDFLADHEVYRPGGGLSPLVFDEIWNDEHDALAKGLCNDLLEPLMMDERFGPISIADAFWPCVFKSGHSGKNHRWTEGKAAVDIALYRLVDEGILGRGLISAQPDADCREFDHREVVCGELFVACCDAPELLEFVEEALNPITQAVENVTEGMGSLGVATVRNDRHGVLLLDHRSDPFGVVGLVAEEEAVGRKLIFEQSFSGRAVMGLARAQGEAERQAAGVDHGMDLRGQSASGTTHATIRTPLFEPAACW